MTNEMNKTFDELETKQALHWHLDYNFYPQTFGFLIDPAYEAIQNCSAGKPLEPVTVVGERQETSEMLVEALRLGDMVDWSWRE